MDQHQFSTPKVVYLGLAYPEKQTPPSGTAARARLSRSRPRPERVALRRAVTMPPAALR